MCVIVFVLGTDKSPFSKMCHISFDVSDAKHLESTQSPFTLITRKGTIVLFDSEILQICTFLFHCGEIHMTVTIMSYLSFHFSLNLILQGSNSSIAFYPFKSVHLQHLCHMPSVWCFSPTQLNCARLVSTLAAWWMAHGWAETISWAPPWPSTVIQATSSRVIPVSPAWWVPQTDPNGTELCPAVKVLLTSYLFCTGKQNMYNPACKTQRDSLFLDLMWDQSFRRAVLNSFAWERKVHYR